MKGKFHLGRWFEARLRPSQQPASSPNALRSLSIWGCLVFAALVYALSGILKVYLLAQGGEGLNNPNPVFFFLENKAVIAVASALEIGSVAAALWLLRYSPSAAFVVLLWMSCLLVLYRVGLHMAGARVTSCRCFGLLERIIYPVADTNRVAMAVLAITISLCLCGLLLTRNASRTFPKLKSDLAR